VYVCVCVCVCVYGYVTVRLQVYTSGRLTFFGASRGTAASVLGFRQRLVRSRGYVASGAKYLPQPDLPCPHLRHSGLGTDQFAVIEDRLHQRGRVDRHAHAHPAGLRACPIRSCELFMVLAIRFKSSVQVLVYLIKSSGITVQDIFRFHSPTHLTPLEAF
jgi:hypothetical protein